ncbi:hypothetical protein ACJJTC_010191 [Scirpophaga incertulas]
MHHLQVRTSHTPQCGTNEYYDNCAPQCPIQSCRSMPKRCKSTCTIPNPQNCRGFSNCSCKDGYIYPNANNSTCIPIYQCPQDSGCNGDKNAEVRERPLPCPSTCKLPNQGYCNSLSPPADCVCKSGYIFK